MGRSGAGKREPRAVPSHTIGDTIWKRVLRGELRQPMALRSFAEALDPDGSLSRYRMVLTAIVGDEQDADTIADRLRGQGFKDCGWKTAADDGTQGRMLIGLEATVMITLSDHR